MSQQYKLLGRLETGELAELYRAQRDGGAPVVIKLFHPRPSDVGYAQAVAETARLLNEVPHPGIAHVVEIGLVKQGEIMVCNSTDPGGPPVFLLLKGAVFETGGAFAHCSCISREYGIPAIQLAGALHKIPDGATITIDGNTGAIVVHEDEPSEAAATE